MKLITNLTGALRCAALTVFSCCVVYTAVIWGVGQVFLPEKANGSLVQNVTGKYVGSRQIAQKFTSDKYFHSRPSAAEYDGRRSSGSNLSPASSELTGRAQAVIKKYAPGKNTTLPLDMVTSSGSGLDPHITLRAAVFQTARVSKARAMSEEKVMAIVNAHVEYPGGILRNQPIVNVLMLNLALDEQKH